jgi:hypothetical protein
VRIDDAGAAFDALHTRLVEEAAVDLVEPCDFAVLADNQLGPLQGARAHHPAEPSSVLEGFAKVRGIDQQLLRDAADVHAGAAELAFFGYGDPRAVAGGNPTGSYTGRAGPDGE